MATIDLIGMEPGKRRTDFKRAPALLVIKQKINAGSDGWNRFLTDTGAVREFMEVLKLSDIVHHSASVDKSGQVEAEKGSEESEFDYAPDLHCDACHGDVEGLKKALASGADKNELDHYGGTALHAACAFGKENCVEILLENGFAVDAVDNKGNTPLHYALSWL